jgi:hypothetical protein
MNAAYADTRSPPNIELLVGFIIAQISLELKNMGIYFDAGTTVRRNNKTHQTEGNRFGVLASKY